jgi:hypothetical protein
MAAARTDDRRTHYRRMRFVHDVNSDFIGISGFTLFG